MNDSLPVLSLDQASRQLSGRTIIDDLDLRIFRGEVLGLLGVNGAGKSTTLRMMSGLLAPTAGHVRLGKQDLYASPELGQKQIGYLAEDPPLYGELTVDEYLCFCARLHGIEHRAVGAAVERAIERCELGDMRRRLTSLLSKGFRQRVGLAQAIIHEPDLIVLDEPASGLDPIQALRLRELIRTLAGTHAVVLSTHVLSDVLACCDRVAILHHGRLRHSANLSELDTGTVVLVRVERMLAHDDWMKLGMVVNAEPTDAGYWRIGMHEGTQAGALAQAIAEQGFGLQELRGDNNVLEQIFVRIAAEEKPVEAAP